MSCCTYKCDGSHGCPVRAEKITANAAQPEEQSSLDVIGGVMLNGLLAVVLVAVVICMAGWMGHYLVN